MMTPTIGVLSPITGGFYFGEVLAGVVEAVAAAGGSVCLVQTLDAGRTGDEFLPAPEVRAPVAWDQVDAVVSIAQAASPASLASLRDAGLPVALAGNEVDGLDALTVVADNTAGVRTAVTHLVEHGHRRIAFVGNLAQSDMRERHAAYVARSAELGLDVEGLHVPTADHVEQGGRGAVGEVLRLRAERGITAVVTTTDRIALGLMAELRAAGLSVPTDLAVVGFDDVEEGWHSSPPLATVDQHAMELGRRAAGLLLAGLRGEPVRPGRHTVASTFVPRGSCGCSAASVTSARGDAAADEMLEVLTAVLARAAEGDEPGPEELDDLLACTLARLFPVPPSPEVLERFTERVLGDLTRAAGAHGAPGPPDGASSDVVQRCVVRLTVRLADVRAATTLARADELSVSLAEQYDVGMGLLGEVGSDPSTLGWLDEVAVPLGCLGLWADEPGGRLRVAGVYDPHERLGDVPGEVDVREFPPRALLDALRSTPGQVAYVIPVRGATGDHGLLCVVGPVDAHARTGRATYNHWAALLAVALKQQGLVEEIRRSEERYSLAASATADGLWDWDVSTATCYYSERCQELLQIGVARGTDTRAERVGRAAPELNPWLDTVHPADRPLLADELWRLVSEQVPIEVEHRVAGRGGYRWTLCRAVPVGEPGRLARRVVGSLTDIHPRKAMEERLRQGALYDAVTGLPNRRLFLERLGWAVEQAQRRAAAEFAVVFLDLDGFKLINDSLGHLMGDHLLRTIGERLRGDLRSVDTAARFGGDEFAVLLTDLPEGALLPVVERIQDLIAAPVTLGDQVVQVGASVGITTSRSGHRTPEEVLRDADIAMYHAKETERGSASVFEPEMHLRATGRLQAQSELRAALLTEQFVMHYQPLVPMTGGPLTHLEALVRWQHPERGLLLPAEFLDVLQDTGMVVALGQWVLDSVCAQIARWRAERGVDAVVSVNLSHREFWSDQLLATVTQALSRHDVAPSSLVLEITESVVMTDPDAARQVMTDLRAAGLRLHMDDFGTGQSSLGALRSFPVDALKLDRSFVGQLEVDPQTTELVRVIVEMGRALGLEVVAEGVETDAQAGHLRGLGCRTAQGWLYARALPGSEAGELLGTDLLTRT
ncbi:EAL domain-containing protein [Cellulomonas sp. APG4]|uniref:EAL domain-containing protein n=1 Tax=Cellulomonas sp. APG4 TaxID=1538656 RepID=UPI00137B038A|nr:EAL domain-containing protein [Cellulomonas sp. APG4]NCT92687.1 EAL domain-containing protein [Cellulomonas sp. APG4]